MRGAAVLDSPYCGWSVLGSRPYGGVRGDGHPSGLGCARSGVMCSENHARADHLQLIKSVLLGSHEAQRHLRLCSAVAFGTVVDDTARYVWDRFSKDRLPQLVSPHLDEHLHRFCLDLGSLTLGLDASDLDVDWARFWLSQDSTSVPPGGEGQEPALRVSPRLQLRTVITKALVRRVSPSSLPAFARDCLAAFCHREGGRLGRVVRGFRRREQGATLESEFMAYAERAAKNFALDFVRDPGPRRPKLDEEQDGACTGIRWTKLVTDRDLVPVITCSFPDPQETVIAQDEAGKATAMLTSVVEVLVIALNAVVPELSEIDREILCMRLSGKEQRDIATEVGLSYENVRQHSSRMLRSIRSGLEASPALRRHCKEMNITIEEVIDYAIEVLRLGPRERNS